MTRVLAAAATAVSLLVPRAATAQAPAEPLAPPVAATAGEVPLDTPGRALGYALGYRIGGRILADHRALEMGIDDEALARGLADAVGGVPSRLEPRRLERILAEFESAMQKRQEDFMKRMAAAGRDNLQKGRAFLEANAARPGVKSLPSGLQYEVLREGSGPRPRADDVVVAHYRGTHIDGREFDGTDPQGEPASFPLRGVVPGWREALPLMKTGARWRLWLPPELAYGDQGSPPTIEPNEVLVFEIELVRSEPGPGP